MPESAGQRIAVVGAAGFVGGVLLRQFEESGVRVTAVARGPRELVQSGMFHDVLHPHDAIASASPHDVVINLAVPVGGRAFEHPARGAEIARLSEALLHDGGRLVHASSVAVFGFRLDHRIVASAVRRRRDEPYVEAKIDAEHLFAQVQARRGAQLDIVRFGNVWGPGSPSWTLPIVQRLISGRPVGVKDHPQLSNLTDVENTASCLRYLCGQPDLRPGVFYRHLAEFSSAPWSEWVEPVAEALGVDPVYAEPSVLDSGGRASGLAPVIAPLHPRTIYRALSDERTAGSLLRATVRAIPPRTRARLRATRAVHAAPETYSRTDRAVLGIIAAEHEFRSANLEGWSASVDQAASIASVLEWLAASGAIGR